MKRTSVRRSVIAGAGVAALITTTLTLQSANAAPTAPAPLTATAAGALATDITADLGADATAGSYYDAKDRKLVVNVVDDSAAERVRAAGAEPRVVKHSLAALNAARSTLKAKATIPGTSWAMNPKSNAVVVTADRTVRGDKLAKLTKVTDSLGDRVTVKRSTNTLKPLLAGGDAIWGSGSRCSLGFNVTKGGEPYFLTAGHCTNAVSSWSDSQGGQEVAATEGGSFPGDDYGHRQVHGRRPAPKRGQPVWRHAGDRQGRRGHRRPEGDPQRQHHSGARRRRHRARRHRQLPGGHGRGADPDHRVRRARRQRRLALRGRHRAGPDLGRQRQLRLGRRDLLPAGDRGALQATGTQIG